MTLAGYADVYQMFDMAQSALPDGPVVWVVGTNVYYSVFVEFGTSKMPAQPFFRPAVRMAERNVQSYIQSHESLETAIAAIAYDVEGMAKKKAPVDTGRLKSSITAKRVQ